VTDMFCFSVLPMCSNSSTLSGVIHFCVNHYLSFLEGEDTVLSFTVGSHYPQMLCHPRRTKASNFY
jgi:hypothetical protein